MELAKIGLTPQGAFNASNAPYEYLDTVTDNGKVYLSKKDNNNDPLTNTLSWEIWVESGEDGVDGTNAQSFIYKDDIDNYAGLPSAGNSVNDAYYNLSDKKLYVFNGTSFPADGNGIILKGEDGANGTAEIPDWQPQNYVEKSLTIKDDTIWRVPDGQSAGVGDVPGVSSKWVALGVKDIIQNITEITNVVDPSQLFPSEGLYNDTSETPALDVFKRIDKSTGVNINYRETSKWFDGSDMNDSKSDGVIFRKKNDKYYVAADYYANQMVDFGRFGEYDTPTKAVATFNKSMAFLKAMKGGILLFPPTEVVFNAQIHFEDPLIGARGCGINKTRLKFIGCSGLKLSSFVDFSFGHFSDFSVIGDYSDGTIGIEMPNTNYCFLDRFFVSKFDFGVVGTTAVMSKLSNFSIIECNKGMLFQNGCYFLTVRDGNVRACRDYGIKDAGCGIKVLFTDIELIGEYNPSNGKFENGTAFEVAGGTSIIDCHIEASDTGISLGYGGASVSRVFVGGCLTGVAQQLPNITGKFAFDSITFASVTTHFNTPTTNFIKITDASYFNSAGAWVVPVNIVNPHFISFESNGYDASTDKAVKTFDLDAIKIGKEEVYKGHKFVVAGVNIGTIATGETKGFDINLPIDLTTNEYNASAFCNFQSFNVPNGIIVQANVKNSSITGVIIRVSNISSTTIDLGARNMIISIFN